MIRTDEKIDSSRINVRVENGSVTLSGNRIIPPGSRRWMPHGLCLGSGKFVTIQVRVEDGLVTLSGTVSSPAARKAAEEAASRTAGATGVRNNVEVVMVA